MCWWWAITCNVAINSMKPIPTPLIDTTLCIVISMKSYYNSPPQSDIFITIVPDYLWWLIPYFNYFAYMTIRKDYSANYPQCVKNVFKGEIGGFYSIDMHVNMTRMQKLHLSLSWIYFTIGVTWLGYIFFYHILIFFSLWLEY